MLKCLDRAISAEEVDLIKEQMKKKKYQRIGISSTLPAKNKVLRNLFEKRAEIEKELQLLENNENKQQPRAH